MKNKWIFWMILAGMVLLSISIEPNSRLGFAASSAIEPQAFNQPAFSCFGNNNKSNPAPPADTTPPETSITSNPPNPSGSTDATFEFTCDEGNCTYDCQLDSGGWTPCTSPKIYSSLSESNHTFEVKAWDGAGNVDPTPASYSWTISFGNWIATSMDANVPSARYAHTAIWIGSEMIVWGGNYYDGSSYYFNDGGRYNPVTDSWTPTSTGANVPSARYGHTAVWTGSEMIIWGGTNGTSKLNTGGRYNPSTDSWTPTDTSDPDTPSPRRAYTAVWTGSEMIIWGGDIGVFPTLTVTNTGGRYNPAIDSWTPTSTGANVPWARFSHTAIWTGLGMIIWGGGPGSPGYNSGGQYNPATDSWTPSSIGTNVPSGRIFHSAVWTGSEMIIWSGQDSNGYSSTGGRYNPITDSWTPTSTGANVPAGRNVPSAIWTGSEMIVFGGKSSAYTNTGGKYNPITDSWTPTSTGANVPSARSSHTAVWTGSEMIIWGGWDGSSCFNTGGIYSP